MSLPVLLYLDLLETMGQAPREARGHWWRGRDDLRVSGEGDRGHGWVTGARQTTPDTAGHCQHPSAPVPPPMHRCWCHSPARHLHNRVTR